MKSSHSDRRSQDAYLHDMLESARCIQRYMKDVAFEAFWEDGEKRDAVAMRLGVIGDAARQITRETEANLRDIPFKELRGMRNRIAHDCGRVDYRVFWEVTQEGIEPLVTALERYLSLRPKPGVISPDSG